MKKLVLLMVGLCGAGCSERVFEVEPDLELLRTFSDGVDETRLLADVRELFSAHRADTKLDCESLGLGDDDRVCHHSRLAARQWLLDHFAALGVPVELEASGSGMFETGNLVVELAGRTRADEIVLVGAHYDSFYGGADDNSSGVAAVLELVRLFRDRESERTMRFVLFDFEEFGYLGTERYLQSRPVEEQIVATLVFDCIAYSDSAEGSQRTLAGFPTPTTGDFVAIIGNEASRQLATDAYGLNAELGVMKAAAVIAPGEAAFPMTGQLLRSDHGAFWLSGRPAVFLTDTANLRNPNYHTLTDTPDTLDPQFFRNVVRLSAATLGHWGGLR